ncbi:MAG TPA: quinone oxidoreductase [Holophagaceae bacterium]|nr:quinone oxidoreductase [Holophagaceae bacterium]
MRALTFSRFGAPEVLEFRELPDPIPGPGEVRVRTRAIGMNFADCYRRQGRYHLRGEAPWIAGYEAAGEVEALGEGVTAFQLGDRVAFADSPFAHAERVVVPEGKLIPLPADISFETAAALLLQGLTAQYLVRDSHAIERDESVLVHAAAGGVGLLLVQMATLLGAQVLGIVSKEAKVQAVLDAGAKDVVLFGEDWSQAARDFSCDVDESGMILSEGVDVVYDSVGSTLQKSLEAARTGGHVVFFGMAGGDPVPVDPRYLMDTSKSLTGGDLWNVLRTPEDRRQRAEELFDWVRRGLLKVSIAARVPLAEGAEAHRLLESRTTTGKVLLIP